MTGGRTAVWARAPTPWIVGPLISSAKTAILEFDLSRKDWLSPRTRPVIPAGAYEGEFDDMLPRWCCATACESVSVSKLVPPARS